MVESVPKILVVDDEDIVLSFVSDALEDEGCNIETTASPLDALERLKSGPCDLLLTDIRMPEMDGIELVEHARRLVPGIHVIFMTGYANLNSAKDAIKQGAIDYIMKPFELDEIRQSVRKALIKIHVDEANNPGSQLQDITDLTDMLFNAGDKKSLVVSSLKFAMMHQHADFGSLLWNENDKFSLISIEDDITSERHLPLEPLASSMGCKDCENSKKIFVVTHLEDHPLYTAQKDDRLKPYLSPSWFSDNQPMIVVPVFRAEKGLGMMMLGWRDKTQTINDSDRQFLTITASQLAITLENLTLLTETREAYGRLKQLQDQTIELEKMATRGQMSAEIGHELNNFMGVIAANVSLLDVKLRKRGETDLLRHIDSAIDTIEKIKSFTSNLMDVQPVSSKREKFAFDQTIKDVVEYLLPQKRFHNVQIEIVHLDSGLIFEGDNTQILQLLYNLFNNAADATSEKEFGKIEVSVVAEIGLNEFTVHIKDNGTGFDKELLEKAFHEQFTTKETGHGFGLVVCNRIIEQHGGKLSINSTKGEGTTISIRFPMAEEIGMATSEIPVLT